MLILPLILLTLAVQSATRPAPAPEEVIAIVGDDHIERDQIESGPEQYSNQRWYRFLGRALSGLLTRYAREHNLHS